MPAHRGHRAGDLLLTVALRGQGRTAAGSKHYENELFGPAPHAQGDDLGAIFDRFFGHSGAGSRVAQPSSGSPTRPGEMTFTGTSVQLAVSADGVSVKDRHTGVGTVSWAVRAQVGWPDVEALIFSTNPHDSVVALYMIRPGREREFVLDRKQFTNQQWDDLTEAVRTHTDGRLALRPM